MKKRICLVLALLMVFSMAACQSAPEAANPTASTEAIETTAAQEEPVETAPLIELESVVDQKLQENNAVTVTFDTHDEYEKVIYEMGFFDYIGLRYRYTMSDTQQRLFPKQLTYDGENFRYEFDYLLNEMDEDVLTEGWVLYGTTSDEIIDLVPVPEDQIIEQHEFKLGMSNDLFSKVNCHYYTETSFIMKQIAYYQASKHLYTLVNVYERLLDAPQIMDVPRVLGDDTDAQYLQEEFELKKPVVFETIESDSGYLMEVGEFSLSWGGREERFQFRRGMTLADWVSSSLNTGSWMAGPNSAIYSYNYDYVVLNSNRNIEELLTDGSYIYAAPHDPEIIGGTTNPGMVSKIMTNPSPNVAYAHLLNWQTPLLASGISIVEEGQKPSTYRMFDISAVTAKDANVSVYLRNIDAEIAADMELYVVKDYEEILSVLHEYGISRHTAPISMEAAESSISSGGVNVPFEHLDSNMAVANFSPVESNFLLDKDTAFVITYQGSAVYWVHMPAIP